MLSSLLLPFIFMVWIILSFFFFPVKMEFPACFLNLLPTSWEHISVK